MKGCLNGTLLINIDIIANYIASKMLKKTGQLAGLLLFQIGFHLKILPKKSFMSFQDAVSAAALYAMGILNFSPIIVA